jgi:hypothetical protein
MEVDMETCKVFFPLETSREEAEKIIHQHDKTAEIANFYQKKEIGCNVHTFAVATMPFDSLGRLEKGSVILKIERLESFRVKQTKGECCKGSGCGCP